MDEQWLQEVQSAAAFPLPFRVLFLLSSGVLAWATNLYGSERSTARPVTPPNNPIVRAQIRPAVLIVSTDLSTFLPMRSVVPFRLARVPILNTTSCGVCRRVQVPPRSRSVIGSCDWSRVPVRCAGGS